jgi:ribose 5-phosphate isomerase B
MKIAIGSDHAGFRYKGEIIALLQSLGHDVTDFGTHSTESTDYPRWIYPAAHAVASGQCERGIVLGGSGNGEAIVANKVHGVRCALCFSEQTAIWARQHNNANALAIGERTVSLELALDMVRLWLDTPFEGGRHVARLEQITEIETAQTAGRPPVFPSIS